MIPTLRDYQTELTNRVRAQVACGKRIIVVQATTGASSSLRSTPTPSRRSPRWSGRAPAPGARSLGP